MSHFKKITTNITSAFRPAEISVSNRTVFFYSLFCIAEIILISLAIPQSFESNDDMIMNTLVSGKMTGDPSEFIMFSNILLGKFLAGLFSLFPNVNWYTWYLITTIALGHAAMQYCFLKIQHNFWIRLATHLLIFGLVIQVAFILQFTRVASIACAAGFLLILSHSKGKHLELLAGILLISLGGALRYPVFIMYVLLGMPFLAAVVLRWKKRQIIALGISFALVFSMNIFHENQYNQHPEFESYRNFNSLRSSVTTFDSPDFKYTAKKAWADSLGWSENDFMMVSNFNLDVGFSKFSEDNLSAIATAGSEDDIMEMTFSTHALQTLKNLIKKFGLFIGSPQYLALFLLIALILLARLYWALGMLGLYACYIFFLGFGVAHFGDGNLKPWVLYGMTTPFFILALWFFHTHFSTVRIPPQKWSSERKQKLIAAAIAAGVALPIAAHLMVMPRAINERIERDSKVHSAIQEYNDPFYAAWTSLDHYNLFELPYDMQNVYGLGWRAGSPWNRQLIEKYTGNPDIGIFNITGREVVWYFRTSEDTHFQDYRQMVETFYEENFPEHTAQHEIIPVTPQDTLHRYSFFVPKQ